MKFICDFKIKFELKSMYLINPTGQIYNFNQLNKICYQKLLDRVGAVHHFVGLLLLNTPFSFNFDIFYIIYKLDLSCKYLTEEISLEIGQLQEIHLLNLSHNCLSVYKPKRYSKLKVVESLDFSYNRLSGRIPR